MSPWLFPFLMAPIGCLTAIATVLKRTSGQPSWDQVVVSAINGGLGAVLWAVFAIHYFNPSNSGDMGLIMLFAMMFGVLFEAGINGLWMMVLVAQTETR